MDVGVDSRGDKILDERRPAPGKHEIHVRTADLHPMSTKGCTSARYTHVVKDEKALGFARARIISVARAAHTFL